MRSPFLFTEDNLGRAGLLLPLEIGLVIVGGMALDHFGFNSQFIVLVFIPFQIAIAWFLSQAAKAQGRNQLLFGLLALPAPPLAISVFCYLHIRDSWPRLIALLDARRGPN